MSYKTSWGYEFFYPFELYIKSECHTCQEKFESRFVKCLEEVGESAGETRSNRRNFCNLYVKGEI